MIKIYTQVEQGKRWLQRHRGCQPVFACVLGFTETGLIPGISAAGATPCDRKYTALADAEFLYNGPSPNPKYPLPPLHAGASPVLISRAVVESLALPLYIFNAGLLQPPPIPNIDLRGQAANCLSTGKALDLAIVKSLLDQGLVWGEKLATLHPSSWLILSECVVGGTTTALAVLTGLGFAAAGKVNSSHPECNHQQKWAVVQQGLKAAELLNFEKFPSAFGVLQLLAAVGDPMQIVVAGMAIAASKTSGVMLAGGTQMLAVYALIQAIATEYSLPWQQEQIVVGTTRWVAEDPTGDTVGLAQIVGSVPLLSNNFSFANSNYEKLRVYEQGCVKEGIGAGAACIAANLYGGWNNRQLLQAVEVLAARLGQNN
ncbi:TIGR00303 family protein [Phormidium sp. LEGE 05292]|uniref:nicotinate mononucleotide-dependent phosphoribosyltransferase CobT n=1 Tax=[Phormidium] sp. LEGE 05292 TaxID=767427 RepID=UPI00187EFC8D|nr:TIGR00303 family protein [Phormidium sp. LEGE 05292]MBE9229812.1 TIGR00303 family protein [Phormidium sp. LEGE 05292]